MSGAEAALSRSHGGRARSRSWAATWRSVARAARAACAACAALAQRCPAPAPGAAGPRGAGDRGGGARLGGAAGSGHEDGNGAGGRAGLGGADPPGRAVPPHCPGRPLEQQRPLGQHEFGLQAERHLDRGVMPPVRDGISPRLHLEIPEPFGGDGHVRAVAVGAGRELAHVGQRGSLAIGPAQHHAGGEHLVPFPDHGGTDREGFSGYCLSRAAPAVQDGLDVQDGNASYHPLKLPSLADCARGGRPAIDRAYPGLSPQRLRGLRPARARPRPHLPNGCANRCGDSPLRARSPEGQGEVGGGGLLTPRCPGRVRCACPGAPSGRPCCLR